MTTMTDIDFDQINPHREPPCDIPAEQAVLGAMMVSTEAIAEVVDLGLEGSEFYRPAHETIFDTIMRLYAKGEPVNALTVNTQLAKDGMREKVGGAPYVHTLVESIMWGQSAGYLAKHSVRDMHIRRLGIEAATRATARFLARVEDAEKIADTLQEEVTNAIQGRTGQDYKSIGSLLQPTLDEIEAIAAHDGSMRGIPTGFADLDGLLNGLQGGQLCIIAARPAIGKSTFALDLCRHAAVTNGIPAAFFSLEMGAGEITMRLVSAEAKVLLQRMRSGGMDERDWNRVAHVTGPVGDAPLFVDDSPNMTIPQIRAKARRLQQTAGLRMIVVDYLQLMSSGQRVESRQVEVSEFSRSLKLLAKELDVPVVALSQLNRGPEQRADKKPMLSDLRESGSLEQDADVVILLHREDAYDPEARAGEADLIVAKHRNGPTGTVTVAFQGHYSRFVDMAAF